MSNYFDAAKVEAAPTFDLQDVFIMEEDLLGSPIDIYYERARSLISRASKASDEGEIDLIPLLFLRLISAVESYFRSILSSLPFICPVCRIEAAKSQVSLGAGYHYRQDGMAVASLEHVSFCTKGELSKQTKKMTGFVCESDSSLREAISIFEDISQLRHAVVHAYDRIYFNNLFELGLIGRVSDGSLVRIRPIDFQRFVSVCHAVTRSYNRALLNDILRKWISKQIFKGKWTEDQILFGRLFDLFCSREDGVAPNNAEEAHKATLLVLANEG